MTSPLALGCTAAAAALVSGLFLSRRDRRVMQPSRAGNETAIIPLLSPFIDSDVADGFLIELERQRGANLVVVVHTFGGHVIPCAQIARALLEHEDASVVVPVRAFSGGTLIALSAATVAMGDYSCLSAVDPIIDETRARHFEEMKDPLTRIDAKEYFEAMMNLVDSVIKRRKVPDAAKAKARTLLGGELYPHGWPLTRAMLAEAGIAIERAAPFWALALERFT